ncbi:MAG: glutathione peroxidase [Acidimicrobium sp. BACL19 MAG-120924-bin39]|jgi:glutathione peroxidase|nr:MAG: glutathione peroxidase [Acidimicrobium sp. BACL19 MAG-120924-bin39]
MSIFNVKIQGLTGGTDVLGGVANKVVLVVNVASKCGLTPQYTGLEALHNEFAGQGFSVVGVPCNQFGAQEPGSAEEITTFCSTTYGVTFPLTEKVDVNGSARHALYEKLTPVQDGEGHSGDIRWNFEKFLVGKDGTTVVRFGPMVAPDDAVLRAAITKALS